MQSGLAIATQASPAQAFDPYGGCGYGFGLALGPSWVFRNRLPTPPYFSIYSPVYYGEQYERPYGISPYAMLPEMKVPDSYQARPRTTTTLIVNPYIASDVHAEQPAASVSSTPIAATGKAVWVENPYVSTKPNIAAN